MWGIWGEDKSAWDPGGSPELQVSRQGKQEATDVGGA